MDAAVAAWRLVPQADIEWLEPEEQLKALREEWKPRTATRDLAAVSEQELVDHADLYHYVLDAGQATEAGLAKMTFEQLRAAAAAAGAKIGRGTEQALRAMSVGDLVTTLCYPELVAVSAHHGAALALHETTEAEGISAKAKAEATDAFTAEFDRYAKALVAVSDSTELRRDEKFDAKAAQDKVNKLEFQAQQAAEELERTRKDVAAAKDATSSADAIRRAPVAPFTRYLLERCRVVSELEVLTSRLQELCQVVGMKPTAADVACVKQWAEETKRLEDRCKDLSAQQKSLAKEAGDNALVDVSGKASDLSEVEFLLLKREEFKEQAERAVGDEAARKAALDEKYAGFEVERGRLLLWCRQQKANIDALSDPDAVQDLCKGLAENYPMMEENFAVLLDLAEDGLLPDARVQQALLEANEVWLNLLISAYERLRFTLIEIHPTSSLENEVRAFAPYAARASEFLEQFLQLLAAPTDAESRELVAPVVDEAAALKEELATRHGQFAASLGQFATTMDALRENDAVLRKAVFARLTFLAQALPTDESIAQRRDDFQAKTAQLVQWAKVKAQGVSWADVRGRIEKIQGVLAEERAAIAQEDEEKKRASAAAAAPPADAKKDEEY